MPDRTLLSGQGRSAASIPVSNGELVGVREFMRHGNRYVDDVIDGRREKIVLSRRGKMAAVVVSLGWYERALAALERAPGPAGDHDPDAPEGG